MLRTEKRKIGDVQYESTTLVATKAIGLGTRVLKIILPAIGELGGGIAEIRKAIATGAEPEILGGGLGKAAVALVAQLDKEDAVELILELLASTTRVDPKTNQRQDVGQDRSLFDTVYAGNLGELLRALQFAMEVSLGSFFGESAIGGLLARADKVMSGMKTAT